LEGIKALESGLLAKANRGILYLDEVNLIEDSIVDVVLDSAAGGVNTVEREGISIVHPAKFIMIGSGNSGEGDLRPQMLDRFGLSVNVNTIHNLEECTRLVLNRMAYENDSEVFLTAAELDTILLRERIMNARRMVEEVCLLREIQVKISDLCARLGIDGLRGDLVTNRATKALVAFNGRHEVTIDDVENVLVMSLGHRLRISPFNSKSKQEKVMFFYSNYTSKNFSQNHTCVLKSRACI